MPYIPMTELLKRQQALRLSQAEAHDAWQATNAMRFARGSRQSLAQAVRAHIEYVCEAGGAESIVYPEVY